MDALDECAELEDVLRFLQELYTTSNDQLHVMLTGRHVSVLEETMAVVNADRLSLHLEAVNCDIAMYIAKRLAVDTKLAKWSAYIRHEI